MLGLAAACSPRAATPRARTRPARHRPPWPDHDGPHADPAARPEPTPAPVTLDAPCPYAATATVMDIIGQHLARTTVTTTTPHPGCAFYRPDGERAAEVTVSVLPSAAAAQAQAIRLGGRSANPVDGVADGGTVAITDYGAVLPSARAPRWSSSGSTSGSRWRRPNSPSSSSRRSEPPQDRAVRCRGQAVRWRARVARPTVIPSQTPRASAPAATNPPRTADLRLTPHLPPRSGRSRRSCKDDRVAKLTATLHTTAGDIVVELFRTRHRRRCRTSSNLAEGSKEWTQPGHRTEVQRAALRRHGLPPGDRRAS